MYNSAFFNIKILSFVAKIDKLFRKLVSFAIISQIKKCKKKILKSMSFRIKRLEKKIVRF